MLEWEGAEVEGVFKRTEVDGAFNRTFDYVKGTIPQMNFLFEGL
jgi:hypothetical protein